MKSRLETYKGLRAAILENEWLQLTVLPDLGAKIASLIYKPQRFEVFFQPAGNQYRLGQYAAEFAAYDTSGADEMFPTIDACLYPYAGYKETALPDHGDLWSIPWQVTVHGAQQLLGQVAGRSLPYEFTRLITLNKQQVQLTYQVKNCGPEPLYGIWAFHGLVACDENTRILLPEAERVVNVHNSVWLGPAGTKHRFPVTQSNTGQSCRLDRIKGRWVKTAEKFYIDGKVSRGQAGLTLNQNRLLYQLLFPKERIPYLGVWINQGGFKDEYNCALEPTNGFYDSPAKAMPLRALEPILPGAVLEWFLTISLEDLL